MMLPIVDITSINRASTNPPSPNTSKKKIKNKKSDIENIKQLLVMANIKNDSRERITYQPNTLPNPGAVVVKSLYTVVAN